MKVNINGRGASPVGILPVRSVELSIDDIMRFLNFRNVTGVFNAETGEIITKGNISMMKDKPMPTIAVKNPEPKKVDVPKETPKKKEKKKEYIKPDVVVTEEPVVTLTEEERVSPITVPEVVPPVEESKIEVEETEEKIVFTETVESDDSRNDDVSEESTDNERPRGKKHRRR